MSSQSSLPILNVACALIEDQQRLLAAQRSQSMPEAGLWEFPGGKLEEAESPEACLKREILEELGIEIRILRALKPVETLQPQRILRLLPFVCEWVSGQPQALEHARLLWADSAQLLGLDWIPADLIILENYLQQS